MRLRNCTLVKPDGSTTNIDERIDCDGKGEIAAVAAHEGVELRENTVMLASSGRVAFEANFAEGLPGWEIKNYCNNLKIGVEELFGERALSVASADRGADTLFAVAGERFPVNAGCGYTVMVRARGDVQMADAAGQRDRGGTAVEFFDANGSLLKRDRFGFNSVPDAWSDSEFRSTVPAGAVSARLDIGADYPNFKKGEKLLVSRVSFALNTPGSGCVQSGWFESVPFRPGRANPFFTRGCIRWGGSRTKFEVSTAPDVDGVPGEWSAFREYVKEQAIPLPANGWLKYRVTLFANDNRSPTLFMIRFGDVCHPRGDFGPVRKPGVEVLTPSPTENLSAPIRFRLTGPVEADHRRTRCGIFSKYPRSRDTVDVTARLRRMDDGSYELPPPDGGSWTKGQVVKFTVHAEDILGQSADETRIVYFAPPAKCPKVSLRADGFTLVDGKPFFPIGIFSVRKAKQNGNSLDNAFRSLKEAGFNLAHTYMWKREDPDFQEFLDASAGGLPLGRHGIWLLTNPAIQESAITVERDRPNILAWYLADDTSRHWTPDSLRMRSGLCAALDGHTHLSAQADSLGNGVKSRYADFIPCTDVFLPEIYTVSVKGTVGNEVLFVGSQMRTIFRDLAEAGSPVKSVWALLQHFSGWGGWERFPTRAEQRAMTYLAIVRGAHGVVWYTYIGSGEASKGVGAANNPETWEDLASVTRELASIQDDLAAPNAPEQPKVEILEGENTDGFGDTSVSVLMKANAGERLLVAVNTSLKPVKAKIAVRNLRQATEIFEKRTLDASETVYGTGIFAITDAFEPNGVHVYRLKSW